jgi:hypothetical protein
MRRGRPRPEVTLEALLERVKEFVARDPRKAAIILTDWVNQPARPTQKQPQQPVSKKKAG